MDSAPERLVEMLRAELDPSIVLDAEEERSERALDWWPLKLVQKVAGAEVPLPACVVRPRSTQEVAQVLKLLHAREVPVVPWGGGSGVHGGAVAGPDQVALDLSALDRILELDETDLHVRAQAGVLLGKLEAWLNERGYVGGHYPQSIDLAQLGGLVATRSAGQFSTRYGNIEDLLLGLEAVLPDGEIVRIDPVARRAVGPDLRELWLGSEGVFGVLTEVTLKVFPTPPERWMGAYALPDMRTGLEAVRRFMRVGWRPAVVRLHDAIEAGRGYADAVEDGEAILLLLSEGPETQARTEGEALDRIVTDAGGRAVGERPVELWMKQRNEVSAFDEFIRMGVIVDTIEVSAPFSRVADVYDAVTRRLADRVPELVVASGHASHCYPQGANLYFTVGAQPPKEPEAVARVYWSIWEAAMSATLEHGGSICHHHGIGRLRTRWVSRELGSAYPLLKRLKLALDPQGLMNPGTLVPLDTSTS